LYVVTNQFIIYKCLAYLWFYHMNRRTAVIVNPNSNGGQTGKNWDSIKSILEKYLGNDFETLFTKKSGDGTTLTKTCLKKGFENIVPIGGDGMVNESANGFFNLDVSKSFNHKDLENKEDAEFSSYIHLDAINPDATMTVLPGGTRNVLVKSLGLPPDFEECCKAVTSSDATKKIDVVAAVVTGKDNGNGSDLGLVNRVFLNAAEIGFGAEIIDRSKAVREKVSSRLLSTFTGIVATLPTYMSNNCEVIEGSLDTAISTGRILTKMTMGVVSNGVYLGGGFQPAPKADMADGMLDTVIIKHSDSFKILQKLVSVREGEESMANEDDIYYSQSQTVRWVSAVENNITVALDGEPVGILPAFFMVFPSFLKIKYGVHLLGK
jgi:diacylglycerol kinase family enzyme